ncbi:DEAD/DEAH box helicase [Phycicoccus sp. MAQZ13P-2]|uniref:DEAD/DEAH box helicase n=1 Tax=Phycicoccus mangrovi TaxID=2840470 RepID=UPI001C000071|nr:DEAD/DEAH box helicase [Phycicoccus mangrovi]MBT9255832.1 DEAD/DEAH box helicase [Phycicoccus mangrovi]MBT9274426.1 DEAD/DEAH box helicase [Phycicoccus mangrovi]
MSTSAAGHLPPAYPERAAWGTASKLRAWQEEALAAYLTRQEKDFLAVATPGAGKTTYALRIATELLDRGIVRAITVVAPTEHLKTQWADAAGRVGIQLNPSFSNGAGVQSSEYHGVALTYAQVAANPGLHKRRTEAEPTLVILDEIHHGGDARSWGDGIREAFTPATRRLSLTGTPFRSDTNPIPFVRYEMDAAGILRSGSDYTYGYAAALRDGVVRPVLFLAYGGAMRWRTKAGDEVAARLGEPLTKDITAHAWRTALDPKGEWIPAVLSAADKRLSEVRRHVPDAGGLVIASNQNAARAYARILTDITGEKTTVVLSDDAGASSRIEEFSQSEARWMVAVRMVSEGVDVPRLAVGVYATSTSTPLFFAQAVGRFVRARRRGETASVFLPSVPIILQLAATMEEERDHALNRPSSDEDEASLWAEEEGMLAAANRTEKTLGLDESRFEALESDAHFDHVLFDAKQFGLHAEVGSEEEQDYLGLPGLLEPDQVAMLLHERQAKQAKGSSARPQPAQGPTPVAQHRALAAQRKELNKLVAAYSSKTGAPHANVHMELRRACGGPELASATSEQVTERIAKIRNWFVGRR